MSIANKQVVLELKRNLEFLSKARELLDYKRELLGREIKKLSEKAFEDREQVNKLLAESCRFLLKSYLDNGKEVIRQLSQSALQHFTGKIREYSFMGIVLANIEYKKLEEIRPIDYGLYQTSENLDKAVNGFQKAVDLILNLSAVETSIYRLVTELIKIRRRTSAIEKVFIPEYQETIKNIEFILEEKEREHISITKILKSRFQKEFT
jgi:V/A-type H+-transporting ATPase subunit D